MIPNYMTEVCHFKIGKKPAGGKLHNSKQLLTMLYMLDESCGDNESHVVMMIGIVVMVIDQSPWTVLIVIIIIITTIKVIISTVFTPPKFLHGSPEAMMLSKFGISKLPGLDFQQRELTMSNVRGLTLCQWWSGVLWGYPRMINL